MKHKLMIKTHLTTKLKYLCYTTKDGIEYQKYNGSGKKWKNHLKQHGNNIHTELIFETEDYIEFKKFAIKKSIELNIVDSKEWANLKIEEGDGGDTVSNKQWITNGELEKYILKIDEIPVGWYKGRSNKCVFKNPEKQKIYAKSQSFELRSSISKKIWESGKMDKRKNPDISGDNNPSKIQFLSIIETKRTYSKNIISRYYKEFKEYY